MSARVVELIEVGVVRGNGNTTPIRRVTQYYAKDGTLLAESDPSFDLSVRSTLPVPTQDGCMPPISTDKFVELCRLAMELP